VIVQTKGEAICNSKNHGKEAALSSMLTRVYVLCQF